MILKPTSLSVHLKDHCLAIYLLTGPEQLLSDQAAIEIKQACRKLGSIDEIKIDLSCASDWPKLTQSASNYSIFSEKVLVDARYDKKTLDAGALKQLINYANQRNTRSIIILRAPNLAPKALSTLSENAQIAHLHFGSLTANALTQWIQNELKKNGIFYQSNVPAFIHQYSQHNLQACAQIIEKLSMTHDLTIQLTCDQVMPHIIDQSEFSMYELADTCLGGDLSRALHILQRLREDRVQPTLILWVLTQEIRQLFELKHKLINTTMHLACRQQKIWPQRVALYEQSLARLSEKNIHTLLQDAQHLDEQIKSNLNQHIWHALEQWIMCWTSSDQRQL